MRAEIPKGVWLLLIMVAAFGCVTTTMGLARKARDRNWAVCFFHCSSPSSSVLIFDISHSRVGLIQVSQQPLVDLQQSMSLNQ
ncbi:MAG TPA: hypothetical protein VFD48_15095 [Pyrinomonadaceae bacterium]|nr:hypothetical protein [Pyrinomonadaceae bacterium]